MNKTSVESLKVYGLDTGLLLARGMVGTVFVFHGAQKLFAWWGGYGVEGTAGFFAQLGIPFPTLNVYLAGGTEFFGGLLLIAGLASRFSSLGLFFTMLVAVVTAHWGKFDAAAGGMEYALTLAVVALGLALTGPGRIALDSLAAPALAQALANKSNSASASQQVATAR